MSVRLTVVTATFNVLSAAGADALERCVRSVAALSVEHEHLVVDGASTDGTLAKLQALAAELPSLRIVSEPDTGIYDALNKGLVAARGNYFYVLGADDFIDAPNEVVSALEKVESTSADVYITRTRFSNGRIYPKTRLGFYDMAFKMAYSHQGCLVPESLEYRADIGHGKVETVRLARFLEGGRHLKSAWLSADESVRRLLLDQIVATFPIQSFIGGIDTYQHPELDNVMVDAENRLWFIDNGASFDYRARGPRKYWFWDRADLMGRHGYYSLRYDKRVDISTYDQSELRALLEGVSDESLRLAARKYDFPALVKTLTEDYQHPVLIDYAKKLQIWASCARSPGLREAGFQGGL